MSLRFKEVGISGKWGVVGGQGCKEEKPVRKACFDSPGSAVGGGGGWGGREM